MWGGAGAPGAAVRRVGGGGVAGVGTLVFAFGVGPLTQFFLRYLVVRLDPPPVVALDGETP